jgi:hypothetical protein
VDDEVVAGESEFSVKLTSKLNSYVWYLYDASECHLLDSDAIPWLKLRATVDINGVLMITTPSHGKLQLQK